MAGYKRRQTYYTLEFDDEFEGLEVKLRRGSIRERMQFEAFNTWQERVDGLPPFLVEWNVTDEQNEVLPLTAESLWSLEEPTLAAIMRAYTEAIYPPAPFEQPSTDGANESETASTTPLPPEELGLGSSMTVLAS